MFSVEDYNYDLREDLIAQVPEGALGAALHASIDGTVKEATAERIVIER